MSMAESYQALARLLDYPGERDGLTESYREVIRFFKEEGIDTPTAPFGEMLRVSTLSELQEDYVAQFDFNPAQAPYLGHHLYGDNQKKGAYLIGVKEQFRRFEFAPCGCELPDHLTVLLSFLAHLARRGEDAFRRSFIAEAVQPGVEKLLAGCAPRGISPWLTLVEAVGLVLSSDCREVPTC